MLKKILFLGLLMVSFSCDDGDFEELEFQFEKTINKCGDYLLYKTNKDGTEVLALSLKGDLLTTEVGEKSYSAGGDMTIVYRLFEKRISNNYFCQNIPPSEPKIRKDLKASSKTKIIITTSEVAENKGKYQYKIVFKNLLFEDDKNFYFDTFDFGTFVK